MMGNGYNGFVGSTGYAPNNNVNLVDVTMELIIRVLNEFVNRCTCTGDVANEILKRCQNNINFIVRDIESKFVRNGTCDSNQIYDYLANHELPAMVRCIENEIMRMRNGGFSQQPLFTNNYSYGGWANNNYGNQNNSWMNQNYNNNGFGNFANATSPQISQGSLPVPTGFDKIARAQQNTSNNQEIFTNTPPGYQQRNIQPTTINVTTTPKEDPKDELTKILSKSYKNRNTRHQNKISIDKLTTNTSTLIDNIDFIDNKINVGDVEYIHGSDKFNEAKNVTSEAITVIDDPEHCKTITNIDTSYNGEIINVTNYDLKVPVVNAQEAIELVKEAAPDLVNHEQWIASIHYKELITKKIEGYGSELKTAFRTIKNNICKLEDMNTVNSHVVSVIKRQIIQVRQYLEALVVDRVNELFRTTLYFRDNPKIYPSVDSWNGIYLLVDETQRAENKYVDYMFEKYGQDYVDNVYLCVKSAINDIFNSDDYDDDDVVVDATDENLGLIAKLSEVTCVSGMYRMCDYGNIAGSTHMEQLLKKFNRDYVVHKFSQTILATNVNISKVIGTSAMNTIILKNSNLQQHVFHAICKSLREHGFNRDMMLIEMDTTGSYINSVYRINLGIDESLIISRE